MPHPLNWLYYLISKVLLFWHWLFSQFLDANGGWSWALAIGFLVITIRVILFPLFVKQYHSMRAMQTLQPQVAALKKKHANDRQAQAQAMMALQKEAGVNPLGGCLPLVVQAPVFISLYHVLRRLRPGASALYGWSDGQTKSAIDAKFFGAPIPASFRSTDAFLRALHASPGSTRFVIAILLLVSCVATFATQWQNYSRNKDNLDGQQAMIQRLMLVVIPIGLAFSGLVFGLPLGVLLYWLTNNLWTMGQQFYMLTRVTAKLDAAAAATPPPAAPPAPKPGARPVRDNRGRIVSTRPSLATPTGDAPDSRPPPRWGPRTARTGRDKTPDTGRNQTPDPGAAPEPPASPPPPATPSGDGSRPANKPPPGTRPAVATGKQRSRPAAKRKKKRR
ncbi:MAG: membrane protein insertase YidC [Mycobacteriales bacterium]